MFMRVQQRRQAVLGFLGLEKRQMGFIGLFLKEKRCLLDFFNINDNKYWQEGVVISIKHRIFMARLGQKNIITMAKKNSDSIALKKPLTPFFLYRAEIFDETKLKNPKLKPTQLASLIGEMWKKSDSETKTRFEEEYKANKANYDRQARAATEEKSEETEEEVKGKKAQRKKKRVVEDEADFDEDEQEDDEEYDVTTKAKKKSTTKKAPAKKETAKPLPKNAKKPVPKKGTKAK